MTKRSDLAYDFWRQGVERFDYFVTGLTATLTAYVGQHIEPVRLGWNPATVELTALALLVLSTLLGLMRIEAFNALHMASHLQLRSGEDRGALLKGAEAGGGFNQATGDYLGVEQMLKLAAAHHAGGEKASEAAQRWRRRAEHRYKTRNWTLLLGFALLIAARILPAYM